MKRVAVIMGTRPEVLKLAPLCHALADSGSFSVLKVATGQHEAMAKSAADCTGLAFDFDLGVMQQEQTPSSVLAKVLLQLEAFCREQRPDAVVVQGDTTSALAGALAAFHEQIPIAYLESGLRTGRMDSPFPEEMNRVFISRLAAVHFCPTVEAAANLAREGITENVHIVGNTVVDAALRMNEQLVAGQRKVDARLRALEVERRPTLLVTGHRRENFDQPLTNLCRVLLRLRNELPELQIVFPVHLNPQVRRRVYSLLQNEERIHLFDPLPYSDMIWLIARSALIISDSGGIQEEAPSFGRQVLVTRNATERPEALASGHCILCPLQDPNALFAQAQALLTATDRNIGTENPFGDGQAAARCRDILIRYFFGEAGRSCAAGGD